MSKIIYDFVGVGLGPFNLGLACLTSGIESVNGLFLEKNPEFNWHPGMMLEGAHLQTPFMSDLVTLADPSHPLSFLNYLKKTGRLYSFYIREDFFILRREYNNYCRWAVDQLTSIRFSSRVTSIVFSENLQCYVINTEGSSGTPSREYFARNLVLAVGSVPSVPDGCQNKISDVIHSSEYLDNQELLKKTKRVTVVGGGQSAAEIYYDLLQSIDNDEYELNWVTRSPRFFPLEYSKLTLEMTSPEYVDYFYSLPKDKKNELLMKQGNLYKGINSSLINEIYDTLYVKKTHYNFVSNILTNSSLLSLSSSFPGVDVHFRQEESESNFSIKNTSVVLATGYRYQIPEFLDGIKNRINWDEQGRYDVARNYSIDVSGGSVFVQNAELHTHGFVTPDLGMACYRNSCIIKEILGFEYYPIEASIAFQTFGNPESISLGDNVYQASEENYLTHLELSSQ